MVGTSVRLPTLRPYQCAPGRAIVESALGGRGLTFTVVMARQAGKNELSAHVELFLLAKNAKRSLDGVKCAPTFDPQARISLRRLWRRIAEAGRGAVGARAGGHGRRLGGRR